MTLGFIGWLGGIMVAAFVLVQIPGAQGFGWSALLGAGCGLLGWLIGKAADQ